jgi:hypothetical protein
VGSLSGYTIEDIWVEHQSKAQEQQDVLDILCTVDERIQDGHDTGGNASVWVHQLEYQKIVLGASRIGKGDIRRSCAPS